MLSPLPEILVGCAALTVLGTVAVALQRTPIGRQRIGEVVVGACLLWCVAIVVPLPRWPSSAPDVAAPLDITAQDRAHTAPPVTTAEPATTAAPIVDPVLVDAASSVASTEPIAVPWPVGDVMSWLLLAGAAVVGIYLSLARIVLWRTVRRARPVPSGLAMCAVPVLESDEVQRPFCAGLWRPRVLLPARLCTADHADTLRAVLAHELAHVEQRDLRGQALCAAAWPLLYWNPLFYWLRRQIRLAAELVADDIASHRAPKATYVRGLVDLVDSAPAGRGLTAHAVGAFDRPTDFYRRMTMLLNRSDRLASRCSRSHLVTRNLCAMAVVGLGASLFGLPAQEAVRPPVPVPMPSHAVDPTPAPLAETGRAQPRQHFEFHFFYPDASALGSFLQVLAANGFGVHELTFGETGEESRTAILQLSHEPDRHVLRRLNRLTQDLVQPVKFIDRSAASPATKAKPAKQEPHVSLAFENSDVNEIIGTIAKAARANIVVSPEVQGTLTLSIEGVPWRAALDAAVAALGYEVVERQAGILVITHPDQAERLRER